MNMSPRVREELGLNQPILVQFWIYISHVLQGDLGQSHPHQPADRPGIAARLPGDAGTRDPRYA